MLRLAVLVTTTLALGGCSTFAAESPERCHGARRPANPHGSVLSSEAAPPPPPAASADACGGDGA